ncbi:MAG: hypothetical protein ACI9S8_002561 [Chlamydiales bacterium]|jgi:hypothetical protein
MFRNLVEAFLLSQKFPGHNLLYTPSLRARPGIASKLKNRAAVAASPPEHY